MTSSAQDFSILFVGSLKSALSPGLENAISTLLKEKVPLLECHNVNDVTHHARQFAKTLIIYPIEKMEELTRVQDLLQSLGRLIVDQKARIIVIYSFGKEGEVKKFNKIPIHELIHTSTPEKAILIKLRRNLGLVRGAVSLEPASTRNARTVHMVSALTEEADCWLYFMGHAKWEGGKWTIQLKGPPKDHLCWQSSDGSDGQLRWVWTPEKALIELLPDSKGFWVFSGERPVHQESGWFFISNPKIAMNLSYFKEGQCRASKFKLDDAGDLQMAYNSVQAIHMVSYVENPSRQGGALANKRVKGRIIDQLKGHKSEDQLKGHKPQDPQQVQKLEAQVNNEAVRMPTTFGAKKSTLLQSGFKPSLSTMGLALSISELMLKKTVDEGFIAFTFCELLGQAWAGLRVELWCFRNETWNFFCNSDGTLTQLEKTFIGLGKISNSLTTADLNFVQPIFQAEDLIGAIAVSGFPTEADSTDFNKYLVMAGRLAKGVVLGVLHPPAKNME